MAKINWEDIDVPELNEDGTVSDGGDFDEDVECVHNREYSGKIVAFKSLEEGTYGFPGLSVKFVAEHPEPGKQYAVWHRLGFGGEYGGYSVKDATRLLGASPSDFEDTDDIGEALKGVEVSWKAVQKGDFVNAKYIKALTTAAANGSIPETDSAFDAAPAAASSAPAASAPSSTEPF